MSRGALYIASGDQYVKKAANSAESLKQHNPSLPVTVYTDDNVHSDAVNNIVQTDKSVSNSGESLRTEKHFPYNKNLYLDSDTYICGELDDIFKLLDNFDIAATFGFQSETVEVPNDIPISFPELNGGVMAYRDTTPVRDLFESWQDEYARDNKRNVYANQPSFRRAIYYSSVDFAILPRIYNCRTPFHGYLSDKAKIIHGWHDRPLDEMASIINETHNPRLHVGMKDNIGVFSPADASIKDWVLFTMASHGVIRGLIKSLNIGVSTVRDYLQEESD